MATQALAMSDNALTTFGGTPSYAQEPSSVCSLCYFEATFEARLNLPDILQDSSHHSRTKAKAENTLLLWLRKELGV